MFDIGFSELMVIAVVALIVIGPERLPSVARTVGHLMGRLQRYIADVKADIDREVELGDLRKMRDSFQEAAAEVQTTVRQELSKHQQELNEAAGVEAPKTEEPATEPTVSVSEEPERPAGEAPPPATAASAAAAPATASIPPAPPPATEPTVRVSEEPERPAAEAPPPATAASAAAAPATAAASPAPPPAAEPPATPGPSTAGEPPATVSESR